MQSNSMYVWHDDGMSTPRKRDFENDIASFKDLPRCCSLPMPCSFRSTASCRSALACGAPLPVGFPQRAIACAVCREGKPKEVPAAAYKASGDSTSELEQERVASSAAAVAGGAVSYQKAVPFQYPEQQPKQPPKQAQQPAPPKLAPLPPPPGQPPKDGSPCKYVIIIT